MTVYPNATYRNVSFSALAHRAVLRSGIPVLGDKARSFVGEARLADAASRLTAARTNRAARRRAEMQDGRRPMIWAGRA